MTLIKRFLTGTSYCLTAACAWFLVEGLYVALEGSQAPIWSSALNLGVAAALVVLASVIGGVVFVGWGQMLAVSDPVHRVLGVLKRWAWDGTAAKRSVRCAWLIALPLLLGLWLGVAVFATERIMGGVKTTVLAALLIAAVNLLAALVVALISPMLVVPLGRVFELVLETPARSVVRPAVPAGAMLLIALAAVGVLWALYPHVMPHLPWNFALSGVSAAASIVAASWLVHRRWRHRRGAIAALVVGVVGLGVLTAKLPASLADGRAVFVEQTSAASVWYALIHDKLDYDEDGVLHLFGGQDCAPRDASRSPLQTEVVSNGIDDNCSGSDLDVKLADFATGEPSHEFAGRGEVIARRPHIVLITTDALSHGHTSLGGYERDTTPHLAAWAERATVFEHGFALAPSTRLAMSGLLAGTFHSMVPMKNGRIHPYAYKPGVPTIASVLKKQGYKTIFVPGHKYFLPRRWKGYSQGIDLLDDEAWKQAKGESHSGPAVTERALKHLGEHDGPEPLFLWIHYYDHHSPYETPEGHRVFEGDSKVDRYDNEVRFADTQWARVFEAVEAKWDPEEFVMAFTSDHGEAFDERHKRHHHGYDLETSVLHVPFIIQAPRRRGARIGGLVSHADLAPTLANLVGAKPAKSWIGESLIPVLFDGAEVAKEVVYSLFYIPEASKRDEDGFKQIGVRTDEYAYIEDLSKNERRLVAWKEDPVGVKNLAEEEPEVFEVYRYLASKKLEWLREREESLSHLRDK